MQPSYPIDYVIYVDESGDHGLVNINDDYPVFVLALCIFRVSDYIENVVPSMQRFKFKHFKHDMVILHERDIRKSLGPFKLLFENEIRTKFMEDLTELIGLAPFEIISCVVDKKAFDKARTLEHEVYAIAMKTALEATRDALGLVESDQNVPVIFESRGKTEDQSLIVDFEGGRFAEGGKISDVFELVVANKKVNSSGLQLADMVARPLGQSWLRPDRQGRPIEIIKRKIRVQVFLP
jgi:hypothetical protein